MKKVFIVAALIFSTSFATSSYAATSEEELDQIVAVVNDDLITRSEFNQALTTAKMQFAQEDTSAPSEKALEKQVLDQMINRKLQMLFAQQVGVKVTPADVDKTIASIAKQNNVPVDELYKKVHEAGITKENYRQEIHDQLTLQKLQQQEVIGRINISPQEVDRFIQSKAWVNNAAKEYRIDDILIPLSEAPATEEVTRAKQHAEAVIAELKAGKTFKSIAQAESGGEQALQGGDLGWRGLAELPSVFANEVTHMRAKEIAGPIQAPNGFHVIRLAEVRQLDDKKAAPDRKQIEETLLQRKFEEAIQHWVSKLRNQAFIENKLEQHA